LLLISTLCYWASLGGYAYTHTFTSSPAPSAFASCYAWAIQSVDFWILQVEYGWPRWFCWKA
jgi:hypothetical protein